MKYSFSRFLLAPLMALIVAGLAAPVEAAREGGDGGARAGGGAQAGGGGGGGGARASGGAQAQAGGGTRNTAQVNNGQKDVRTNNVRNTSVNNVNVNKNVNVNVEGNSGCCGWDNDYHPVAAAVAVGATVAVTSAIIGSMVSYPPPGCVPVNYGGIVYQQCGTTWYQPQGAQYVVINPPY
jgi:hypothetical protein